MTTRDLVFSVWCANGQDQTRTISALLTIAAGQYQTIKRGGAVLISSSIGGSSFSFQLPAGADGISIVSMVRMAWLQVKDLSADDFTSYLEGNSTSSFQPIFCDTPQ